jgi:hypothetical protein
MAGNPRCTLKQVVESLPVYGTAPNTFGVETFEGKSRNLMPDKESL